MRRKHWLIVGGAGFLGGVVTSLIAVNLLSPDASGYKLLTGPVGIIAPEATEQGYLGAVFSNEPSRSLYIVEVSRAVPADATHVIVGDRIYFR